MRARWRRHGFGKAAVGALVAAFAAISFAAQAEGQARTLKGSEIEAAFTGKVLRVRTEQYPLGDPANPSGMGRRRDAGYTLLDIVVRDDHSIVFRCTIYDPSGRASPCMRTGGGTRDTGVWSIENDRFCYQWIAARGGRKQCYDVHREGSGFRFRLISGPPSTIDGEIVELR